MSSLETNHPAAEIVAIALRKICKLATHRRYASLTEECKRFLANLQLIIPLKPFSPVLASLLEAGEVRNAQTRNAKDLSSNLNETSKLSLDSEASDTENTQIPDVSALKTNGRSENDTTNPSHDPGNKTQPEIALRTSEALPDKVCKKIFDIMRLTIETQKPELMEVALDSLQKLIAFRFIQGSAYSVSSSKNVPLDKDGKPGLPESRAPQAEAVELICSCDDVPDERVELQILKGILTCTTSFSLTLHGQALLLAVRTCYNLFATSRSELTQQIARAVLVQTLGAVFQRMEASDIRVELKPLPVESLGLPKPAAHETGTISSHVQSLLAQVILVNAAGRVDLQQDCQAFRAKKEQVLGGGASGGLNKTPPQPTLPVPYCPGFTIPGSNGVVQILTGPIAGDRNSSAPPPPTSAADGEKAPSPDDGDVGSLSTSGIQETADFLLEEERLSSLFAVATEADLGSAGLSRQTTPESLEGDATNTNDGSAALPSNGLHSDGVTNEKRNGIVEFSSDSNLLDAGSAAANLPAPADPVTAVNPVAAVLDRDAFSIFRALCKLSIHNASDAAPAVGDNSQRGKLLSLELLRAFLERCGPRFRSSAAFATATRQYLCVALLRNCTVGGSPAATQLSVSIFSLLIQRFRYAIKAEIGVFFPIIFLTPFEGAPPAAAQGSPGQAALQHKAILLRALHELCRDGQLLVDLFVNFDCDLEAPSLFERTVHALVRVAQTPAAAPSGGAAAALGIGIAAGSGDAAVTGSNGALGAEQALRQEALSALVVMVDSLWAWYRILRPVGFTNMDVRRAPRPPPGSEEADPAAAAAAASGPGGVLKSPSLLGLSQPAAASGTIFGADGAAAATAEDGDDLTTKRASKLRFQQGVALFNSSPKKGVAFLQNEGLLGAEPEAVAALLARAEQWGIDKVAAGDYLSERDEFCQRVMHQYVDAMEFGDLEFDAAIRNFLAGFRLPGEAQKIDRLMEKFAERYLKCNPGTFKSADVAYVLAYSVIMLNTDAHNPQVTDKMTKAGFLKNNRGINDGEDLPEAFMGELYDRIVSNEIKMRGDKDGMGANGGGGGGEPRSLFNTLLWLMGAYKPQVNAGLSEEAIRRTLEGLREQASGAVTLVVEAEAVQPMLEVMWAPLLGALSVLFDEYRDARLQRICMAGFLAACCLTALTGMTSLRDIFWSSLCRVTHLHSPSSMRAKHVIALQHLLKAADIVGDHLQERWVDVLRCVSRWELIQQLGSGTPSDSALIDAQQQQQQQLAAAAAASSSTIGGLRRTSIEPASLSQDTGGNGMKWAGAAGDGGFGGKLQISPEILDAIDSNELNRVFITSRNLNSEAIVHFVRALVVISEDELSDVAAPRIFSLTKIVEVSHYNMDRVRLVWSRIWGVLSEHFIRVGISSGPRLGLAMYAVDALRQLAMKFLERDELANYTFQNDFLRPFVVVMRQSQAVEIRELIIRCLSQMVLARVANVKSGWKSMFAVFRIAASDRDPVIVRLAFETIEKIVREHFNLITEIDTTTFTDCVNCLVAFTNNPHSLVVALNAIAFLRLCALKLAEGAIGDLDTLPEGVEASGTSFFPVRLLDRDLEEMKSPRTKVPDDHAAAGFSGGDPKNDINRTSKNGRRSHGSSSGDAVIGIVPAEAATGTMAEKRIEETETSATEGQPHAATRTRVSSLESEDTRVRSGDGGTKKGVTEEEDVSLSLVSRIEIGDAEGGGELHQLTSADVSSKGDSFAGDSQAEKKTADNEAEVMALSDDHVGGTNGNGNDNGNGNNRRGLPSASPFSALAAATAALELAGQSNSESPNSISTVITRGATPPTANRPSTTSDATSSSEAVTTARSASDFSRSAAAASVIGAATAPSSPARAAAPSKRASLAGAAPSGRLSARLSTALSGGGGGIPRGLQFSDKDEHMFFWFPLLAGLSELTFDPRQEVRTSALEVLFDILRFHGGSFAESFWVRVFDSVLLPIFDHVRSEVTDTTTFAGEEQRLEEERWLYDTCRRCLDLLVDLYAQFFDAAQSLLPRLLRLLDGFMCRRHRRLAAAGVGGWIRLCCKAGPFLSPAQWDLVMDSLRGALDETAPGLKGLLTPPQRMAAAAGGGASISTASSVQGPAQSSTAISITGSLNLTGGLRLGSESSSSSAPHAHPFFFPQTASQSAVSLDAMPVMSISAAATPAAAAGQNVFCLREGVGARRLSRFKTQASTQRLLVKGLSEVFRSCQKHLPTKALTCILDAIEGIHATAQAADSDASLRRQLATQQAEDLVPEDKAIPDPPLLRLEVESAAAYLAALSVLLDLKSNAGSLDDDVHGGGDGETGSSCSWFGLDDGQEKDEKAGPGRTESRKLKLSSRFGSPSAGDRSTVPQGTSWGQDNNDDSRRCELPAESPNAGWLSPEKSGSWWRSRSNHGDGDGENISLASAGTPWLQQKEGTSRRLQLLSELDVRRRFVSLCFAVLKRYTYGLRDSPRGYPVASRAEATALLNQLQEQQHQAQMQLQQHLLLLQQQKIQVQQPQQQQQQQQQSLNFFRMIPWIGGGFSATPLPIKSPRVTPPPLAVAPPPLPSLGVSVGLNDTAALPTSPTATYRLVLIGRTHGFAPVLLSNAQAEFGPFVDLVSCCLTALSDAADEEFLAKLPELFPLLTQLMQAEFVSGRVHRALAKFFCARIGPVVDLAAAREGSGGGGGNTAAGHVVAPTANVKTVR